MSTEKNSGRGITSTNGSAAAAAGFAAFGQNLLNARAIAHHHQRDASGLYSRPPKYIIVIAVAI